MMRYIWLAIALILGACSMNPAASTINIVTPTVQATATDANPATPTAMFNGEIGIGTCPAITLEAIGNIPANTRVYISTAMLQDEWIYSIADENGNYANARESQLGLAPGFILGTPLATPIFNGSIGMGGYPAITLEAIGKIPANARVNVSTVTRECDGWLYSIYDENGNYENAREEALSFGADVTPGAPTPTSAFGEIITQGTVYARTLVDIENIPAGTVVRLGPSHNGDGEIVYEVYNDELGLRGELPESQLELLELVPYDWSTEIPSPTPQ